MSAVTAPVEPGTGRLRRWLVSPIGAQLTALIVFLLLWQLVTIVAPRVPTPASVVNFLWVEITGGSHGGIVRGEFWEHFAATLKWFSV